MALFSIKVQDLQTVETTLKCQFVHVKWPGLMKTAQQAIQLAHLNLDTSLLIRMSYIKLLKCIQIIWFFYLTSHFPYGNHCN